MTKSNKVIKVEKDKQILIGGSSISFRKTRIPVKVYDMLSGQMFYICLSKKRNLKDILIFDLKMVRDNDFKYITLADLNKYLNLGTKKDALEKLDEIAISVDEDSFKVLNHYRTLHEKCNTLLTNILNRTALRHSAIVSLHTLSVYGGSYLDKEIQATLKIAYTTLSTIGKCKLPITVIRDIINNLSEVNELNIYTDLEDADLKNSLVSVSNVNKDNHTVNLKTTQILGQYLIGDNFTKAQKVKITDSAYPAQLNHVIKDGIETTNYTAGKYNPVYSYLTRIEKAITTEDAYVLQKEDTKESSLNAYLIKDEEHSNYIPKTKEEICVLIQKTILGLQVKAAYFTIA